MLLTFVRYQQLTGDATTTAGTFADHLALAEEILEGVLGRPLASAQRTERAWTDSTGNVYPLATPITVGPEGWTVDGDVLTRSIPFAHSAFATTTEATEITYTGGWVERSANPSASNRLPASIEVDLANAVKRLADGPDPALAGVPAGARSVSLGDASIAWGDAGAPGGSDVLDGAWSPQTLRYRVRRAWGA